MGVNLRNYERRLYRIVRRSISDGQLTRCLCCKCVVRSSSCRLACAAHDSRIRSERTVILSYKRTCCRSVVESADRVVRQKTRYRNGRAYLICACAVTRLLISVIRNGLIGDSDGQRQRVVNSDFVSVYQYCYRLRRVNAVLCEAVAFKCFIECCRIRCCVLGSDHLIRLQIIRYLCFRSFQIVMYYDRSSILLEVRIVCVCFVSTVIL